MCTEHRYLATKCTPRCLRLSICLVENEGEDKVGRRVRLERNEGISSPSPDRRRHIVVRRRAFVVCSNWDLIVELPEELERDLSDIETANEVPCV